MTDTLAIDSDIYEPSMNEDGMYVDNVRGIKFKNGLRCPCSGGNAHELHVFASSSNFRIHCASQKHQKWLQDLNANKSNHYVQNIRLEETVNAQKLIIARMERELNEKTRTIDYLSRQLMLRDTKTIEDNLLDMD